MNLIKLLLKRSQLLILDSSRHEPKLTCLYRWELSRFSKKFKIFWDFFKSFKTSQPKPQIKKYYVILSKILVLLLKKSSNMHLNYKNATLVTDVKVLNSFSTMAHLIKKYSLSKSLFPLLMNYTFIICRK